MIPYEVLDHAIERNGGSVEPWCNLPENSPWRTVKQEWMLDQGIDGSGDDLALIGIWGDAAMYHTRDSLYMSLWNVISGEYHRRYWAGAWSKRTSCQCGCQGRCTFASVWRFWIWVSTVWKCRVYPVPQMTAFLSAKVKRSATGAGHNGQD